MALAHDLEEMSDRLTEIASRLDDHDVDGEYPDAEFDRAVSATTALAVELLNLVGDHDAAAAALTA